MTGEEMVTEATERIENILRGFSLNIPKNTYVGDLDNDLKVLAEYIATIAIRTGDELQKMTVAGSRAFQALLDYEQADEDGVMVLVSRQAIEEIKDLILN